MKNYAKADLSYVFGSSARCTLEQQTPQHDQRCLEGAHATFLQRTAPTLCCSDRLAHVLSEKRWRQRVHSMCTETGPCSPQQRHQPGMMWRRRSEPRAGRDGWGSAALVTMLLCAATPTRGADSGAASAASAPRVLKRQARTWECALNDNPCGDCTNAASSPCHLAAVCVARGSYAWAPLSPAPEPLCVCGPRARAMRAVRAVHSWIAEGQCHGRRRGRAACHCVWRVPCWPLPVGLAVRPWQLKPTFWCTAVAPRPPH